MRLQPRALFALALPVACFCGSYACSSTFTNKLSVYDGDSGDLAPGEDASVPVDAPAEAQAAGDGGHTGDAASKADAGDGGDAASATDGTAPSDAGDGGLEDGALDDASDLDGGATG